MADAQSDAEKVRDAPFQASLSQLQARWSSADCKQIRQKRLAKLGGTPASAGSPSSSKPETPTPTDASTPPAPRPSSSATPTPEVSKPSEASNPFVQLGIKPQSSPSKITISPKPTVPQKRDGGESVRPAARPADNIETWTDTTLSAIFRVTLESGNRNDLHGNTLYSLGSLRGELEEQGSPLRLSTELLDQVVLATAGDLTIGEPLDYLLGCWKRVSRALRSTKSDQTERLAVIQEARRICMNYCIYAVTMPDLFGREPSDENVLAKHLLVDPDSDRGICHDFINEAVSRLSGEDADSVKEMLVGAAEQLSKELAQKSMNDDYKPYVMVRRKRVI